MKINEVFAWKWTWIAMIGITMMMACTDEPGSFEEVDQAVASAPFKVYSAASTGMCWSTNAAQLQPCTSGNAVQLQIDDPIYTGGRLYYQFHRTSPYTTCFESTPSNTFVWSTCADSGTKPGQWWEIPQVSGTSLYKLRSFRSPDNYIYNVANTLILVGDGSSLNLQWGAQ